MGLDLSNLTIVGLSLAVVAGGLGRVYFINIQEFFLRKIIYAATHLVILIQDTGDQIYNKAWVMICECLESVDDPNVPKPIDEIFNALFVELTRRKQQLHRVSHPHLEEQVIHRAITIVSVWKQSILSEIKKADRIGSVQIEAKRFIKIIKDLDLT